MFPYNFPLQEIPAQRPVSGTALSLQEIIIVGNCEKQVFFPSFKRTTEVDFCRERLSLNGRNGFKKYTLKPVNLAANDLGGMLVWWLGMCLI